MYGEESRKLEILTIAILFVLLINGVYALEYRDVCDNSTQLRKFMEFTVCEANNCTFYNFTQVKQCPFGCDTVANQCKEAAYKSYLYIIIGILVLGGFIALVTRR